MQGAVAGAQAGRKRTDPGSSSRQLSLVTGGSCRPSSLIGSGSTQGPAKRQRVGPFTAAGPAPSPVPCSPRTERCGRHTEGGRGKGGLQAQVCTRVASLFLLWWTQPPIRLCHSFCYAGPSPSFCYVTLSVMLDPAPHSVMSLFLICWTQPLIL